MLPHQFKFILKFSEITRKPCQASKDLLRLLFDVHPLEAQKDGLEIGVETAG